MVLEWTPEEASQYTRIDLSLLQRQSTVHRMGLETQKPPGGPGNRRLCMRFVLVSSTLIYSCIIILPRANIDVR